MIKAQVIDQAATQQFIAKNNQSFHQVLAFLDLSEGFTLGIVEIDLDGQIAGLINAIEQHPDCQSMQFCLFNLDDPGLTFFRDEVVQRLSQVSREADKKLVILITGLENAIGNSSAGDYPPFLQDLNYVRDILPRDIPYPILFFLPGYAVTRLGKFAPDVWAWISGIFTFCYSYEQNNSNRQSFFQTLSLDDLIFDKNLEVDTKRLDTFRERLEIYQQSGDDSPDELLYLLSEIGFALVELDEFAKAEVFLEKAQQLIQTEDSLKNQLTQAKIDQYLGYIFSNRTDGNRAENLEKAISYFLQAITIKEKYLPADHPDIATSYANLAELYYAQGKYEQAEILYLKVIAIDEKLLEDHPHIATSYNNLAELYREQGKYEQAEPLYLKAIAIDEKSLPADHPGLATDYNNLAELYREQGKYEQAETLYQKAIAIMGKSLPVDHPNLASGYNNLANLYRTQGKYEQAESLLLKAIAIMGKSLPADHPNLASSYNNLANLYRTQGKYEQAETLYQKAIAIDEKSLPADHPQLTTHYKNLAGLYSEQGKYEQAETFYLRAFDILMNKLGIEHPNTQTVARNLIDFWLTTIAEGQAGELKLLHEHPLGQWVLENMGE